MVTTHSPSSSSASSSPVQKTAVLEGESGAPPVPGQAPAQPPGFVDLLVKSIFEPGANAAVVMAMNICFFLLLITLFGLAAITNWDKHVLALLVTSTILWAAMVWFVMTLSLVQTNPENMPNTDMTIPADDAEPPQAAESRKDQ